jgi:tetraprenyl-beta-curcumene synthase
VLVEVRRRRALAARIPDPALRRLALQALAQKRRNLEGAAAFATLAPARRRPFVVRALVGSQAICDYLDLLCEQPSRDPVANGYALHEALMNAVAGSQAGSADYYRHHSLGEDGGYLQGLVRSVDGSLAGLPGRAAVADSIVVAVKRVAAYQALNHGDADGSYRPFERWAAREGKACPHLSWWEVGAGAGSTLGMHVLLATAANAGVGQPQAIAIERAYFPWIGALHSLLDSLVDRGEDIAQGMHGLIECYASPAQAAKRIRLIAGEALERARTLPQGNRHALILAAMASFYLCDLRQPASSRLSTAVVPVVLVALGGLAAPSMAVLRLRSSMQVRGRRQLPPADGPAVRWLESRKSST